MNRARRSDHIDKIIGENIRYQRRSANVSTAELARELQVSTQQVQKYENRPEPHLRRTAISGERHT